MTSRELNVINLHVQPAELHTYPSLKDAKKQFITLMPGCQTPRTRVFPIGMLNKTAGQIEVLIKFREKRIENVRNRR
jgi:hypothetical protein